MGLFRICASKSGPRGCSLRPRFAPCCKVLVVKEVKYIYVCVCVCVCMYVCMYVCIYVCIYIYTYIYIERERDREKYIDIVNDRALQFAVKYW